MVFVPQSAARRAGDVGLVQQLGCPGRISLDGCEHGLVQEQAVILLGTGRSVEFAAQFAATRRGCQRAGLKQAEGEVAEGEPDIDGQLLPQAVREDARLLGDRLVVAASFNCSAPTRVRKMVMVRVRSSTLAARLMSSAGNAAKWLCPDRVHISPCPQAGKQFPGVGVVQSGESDVLHPGQQLPGPVG